MYIITLEKKTPIEEDTQALRRVSEIHRSDPLDLLIIESPLNCPALEKYCNKNKTSPIPFIKIPETLNNYPAIISEYKPSNPAHLTKREVNNDLEELIGVLEQLNISAIIC